MSEGRAIDGAVEALLFSSEVPLPARRLAELAGGTPGEVLAAIDRLNVHYAETGRAFRIAAIAGGHQMVTVPEHAELLARLHRDQVPQRLSRAALETLAIVAFKQPVTRAEIDRIRGVSASDGVLRHLIERKVVRIAGRAQAPGRPLLYGTTREFLRYFGLASLAELPRTEELEALLAGEEASAREGGGAAAPPDPGAPPGAAGAIMEAGEGFPPPAEPVGEPGESHSGEESDDREGVGAPEPLPRGGGGRVPPAL